MNQEMMCAELGVTRQTYVTYISGGNIPSSKLEKMTAMFGCTAEYLLQPTESWPRETA
jgi:DNA-binding XRE family transcriptional regulator